MTGDHNDRDQRLLLMNQPHRFQAVHSRHEDIEKQQIEIPGFEDRQPYAAIAGDDHAVAGSFEQKSYGRLDGDVIVHDQNSCHSPAFREHRLESMCGCEAVTGVAQALPRKKLW